MTDLIETIDAIIRRERIPDRAGAAIVDMLSEQGYVIVKRGRWERVREFAAAVYATRITMANTEGASLAEMRRVLDAHKALQPSDLARDAPGGE